MPPACRVLLTVLVALLAVPHAGAADSVQLATSEYPPYMSQAIANDGVLVAIAKEAFKRGGYDASVTFLPWARTIDSVKGGQYEGVVGIWHSREREQWFTFSNPTLPTQMGFFKRSDSPITYKALADLKPYMVGTVRGYANPVAFEEAKLRMDEVVDDETNLRKLAAGRVDLVLIDKGVAQYLLMTKAGEFKARLVWLEPAIEKLPLFIALSKKAVDVDRKLAALNKGLLAMEKDGTMAKLISKAGL